MKQPKEAFERYLFGYAEVSYESRKLKLVQTLTWILNYEITPLGGSIATYREIKYSRNIKPSFYQFE